MLKNYATGVEVHGTSLMLEILTFFDTWRAPDEFSRALPHVSPQLARRAIAALVARTLLQARGQIAAAERAMEKWKEWNPAAGFFHAATRDVPFTNPLALGTHAASRQRVAAPRTLVKRLPGAPTTRLPRCSRSDVFTDVLLSRRTWRDFSHEALSLSELGTLLDLTAGVQRWERTLEGRAALKTSPSGGATHAAELYLLALNVRGLDRGLYHHRADINGLELIRKGARRSDVERYLPTQWWYRRAAVIVFFSAVFARSLWRYHYGRAYRALFIEAGHMCQTFCLTATWLRLAPFCAMAIADTRVEKDLGIDLHTESVLYAAGVGCRPPGVDWAPAPRDQAWPGGPPISEVMTNGRRKRPVRPRSRRKS